MPKPYDHENIYMYHAPKDGQAEKYNRLRDKAKELALLMNECCPDSRELDQARVFLETASMWANAAIARNE